MKELLEQGYGVMLIGILTGIGGMVRVLLLGYYLKLLKACKAFGKTKNKSIRYIRQDLAERAGRNQGIKSAMVYTECRLAECRVWGFRVGFLEGMLQQSLLVVPLCGVLSGLAGMITNCSGELILLPLFVSGASVTVLLGMDFFVGLREKSKRIRLYIRDYIENSWEPGMEVRVCTAEDTQMKKERKRTERREKKEEKAERKRVKTEKRADKPVKTCHKKNGKAQEEKRRLTEELLRERRQLEARSFAEQRRKQREEAPVRQAEKEAAATVCAEEKVSVEKESEMRIPEERMQEKELLEERMPKEKLSVEMMPKEKLSVEMMPEKKRTVEKLPESMYETLLSEVLTEYLA